MGEHSNTHNTDTGGGAHIGGDANAGRDVIGRDNNTFNITVHVSGANAQPPAMSSTSSPTSDATSATTNPFGYTGKLTDPALYLVRQPLTREVFDELRKGVSLSIVGESQTGKSSLLWHITQAGPAALGRPTADFVCVDMQLVRTEDGFFEELCDQLGVPTMRANALARKLRGRKIVVCMDEVEKMTWQGFTHDLRSELRGLADGAAAPFSLVVASRTPLDRLFLDSAAETSPLAGLCHRIDVPPFAPAEVSALAEQLLRGSGRTLPAEDIAAAWQSTGGHPARLQQALRDHYRARYAA